MALRLDQVLVIDIEATCWQGEPPPGEESEVIEIGVCVLEVRSGERLGKESLLVRPQRSTVSDFCTELTTLTQEEVEAGMEFAEACEVLSERYRGRQRTWASYGDYDRIQLENQCRSRQVPFPLGPTHLNVKNLLGLVLGRKREVGMAQALKLLDLPLVGTHHRGDDDAWNIAGILAELLRRQRGGGRWPRPRSTGRPRPRRPHGRNGPDPAPWRR